MHCMHAFYAYNVNKINIGNTSEYTVGMRWDFFLIQYLPIYILQPLS